VFSINEFYDFFLSFLVKNKQLIRQGAHPPGPLPKEGGERGFSRGVFALKPCAKTPHAGKTRKSMIEVTCFSRLIHFM